MWSEEVTLTKEEQKERLVFRPLQSLDDSDTKTLVDAGLSEGSDDGNIHTEDVLARIRKASSPNTPTWSIFSFHSRGVPREGS